MTSFESNQNATAARKLVAVAAFLGATGVLLGAFGAHGLSGRLEQRFPPEVAIKRLENYETGVRYQLFHATAILALSSWASGSRAARRGAACMAVGVVIFSGLLYVLTFAGRDWRWLGAIVPLGGLAMTIGWVLAGCAAYPASTEP